MLHVYVLFVFSFGKYNVPTSKMFIFYTIHEDPGNNKCHNAFHSINNKYLKTRFSNSNNIALYIEVIQYI